MKAIKLTIYLVLLTLGITFGVALFGAGIGETNVLKAIIGIILLLGSLKLLGRIR